MTIASGDKLTINGILAATEGSGIAISGNSVVSASLPESGVNATFAIKSTDADGNELNLIDVLYTDENEVSRNIEEESDRITLWNSLNNLPAREREIMVMRFGLSGRQEKTQKEVAEIIGISQSYISRLEKRILKKLKREIEKIG